MKAAKKKIFVSYSNRDKQFSDRLIRDLKKGNFEIWEFSAEIQAGNSIPKKISQALESADFYVIILSPDSVNSTWVNTELDTAIDIETSKHRRDFIIPVLYKECPRPTLISSKRYANFLGDYQVGLREVLQAMGRTLPKDRKPESERERETRKNKSNGLSIVTLGGGNAEYLYKLEREMVFGEKNMVAETVELVGGGGVNVASRLIAAGFETYPILVIGNDRTGTKIQEELRQRVRESGFQKDLQDFIGLSDFFIPNFTSAFATLIVQAARRTILLSQASGNPLELYNHMHRRLERVEELLGTIPTVIHISHLQNLAPANSKGDQIGSKVVKEVLQRYGGRAVIIFNPGSSQIQHGIRYWERELQTVSVLQLNMSEAKQFFAAEGLSTSLVSMIGWFKVREINVVITLDRFGAVGSYRSGREGIVFAWPIELPVSELLDPTGAGDAFAAGIASEICSKPQLTFQDFFTAIDTGRYWSAYACTTLGGAGDCPSADVLSKFRTVIERQTHNPIEVISQVHAERELKLIDKAFE